MATLKSKLLRKLEKVLIKRFPSPATVKLDEHEGIIGVITSDEFFGMDPLDRQSLIRAILETNLSPEERHQVQIIVRSYAGRGNWILGRR